MFTGIDLVSKLAALGVTMTIDPPRRQQRKSGVRGDDAVFTDYVLTYGKMVEIVPLQQAMDPHTLHTHLLRRAEELVQASGGQAPGMRFE